MTARKALAFVKKGGVVLESGRGPVPSLAETIAGAPFRGSWWGHPKASTIFACSRAIRDAKDVLTCRLVDGKVTYVHRRLWPALARLFGHLKADRLAAIREVHTTTGKHRVEHVAFSKWIPTADLKKSSTLSVEDAVALLEKTGIRTGLNK